MNTSAYVFAIALVASGTVAVSAHAQTDVVLDTYGSTKIYTEDEAMATTGTALSVEARLEAGIGATSTLQNTSGGAGTDTEAAASLRFKDGRVDNVQTSEESIDITYRVDGKLFGLIRRSLPVTVEVESDGSVQLDYPWYAFLYSNRPADLEAKIDSAARAQGDWNSSTFTAEKRAEIIARIHAALTANATTSISADVEVE